MMLATTQPAAMFAPLRTHGRPQKAPPSGKGRPTARACGLLQPTRPPATRGGVSRRRTRSASAGVHPLAVARRLFPETRSSNTSSSTDADSDSDHEEEVDEEEEEAEEEQDGDAKMNRGDEVAELLRQVLRRRHAAFQEAWGFDLEAGRPCVHTEHSSGSQWLWEPL